MGTEQTMDHRPLPPGPRHLTTRRGFVVAASLGGVSLYGLWAAYGMAPLGLGADATTEPVATTGVETSSAASAVGHEGHGGGNEGLPADAFRVMVEEFVDRYQAADGVVELPAPSEAASTTDGSAMDMAAEQDHAAMGHGVANAAPQDVFLLAERWYFMPDALRLRRGVTYRFSMMATDVSHGASLQLGIGSHIVRLRRGVLTRRDLTFTEPGEVLVYCTIFCGAGHDQMVGRVFVV